MTDYEFVKRFSDIKLKNICEKIHITSGNIASGRMSKENFSKIKKEILNELLDILVEDNTEDLVIIKIFNEKIKKLEKENRNLKEMI